MFLIDSKQVDTCASMWNVKILGIHPKKIRTIVVLFEILYHTLPGCSTDVFEDNQGRLVFLDPRHHSTECPPRLTISIDVLLLIVKVGIVDT